jgi:hypothetical protein
MKQRFAIAVDGTHVGTEPEQQLHSVWRNSVNQ